MARADLLCELIKYGIINDSVNFRNAAEALCAEERSKQHQILANKIEEILRTSKKTATADNSLKHSTIFGGMAESNLMWEKTPEKRLDHLVLPVNVRESCENFIGEQMRADLLRSYDVEPRNKLLLVGPPGNGKTSLAEAIAESLMLPLLTVRYESIVGSYLGETASRLSKMFEYARNRKCVLFLDEFETLGKERGDIHETGEIKRVVSSLLMHIDDLPSYVITIAATNHDSLLDKAVWRRFQLRLEIPSPTRDNLIQFYELFQREKGVQFGLQASSLAKKTYGISYAEAEELSLEIYRQYILELPSTDMRAITTRVLREWQEQITHDNSKGKENATCQSAQ